MNDPSRQIQMLMAQIEVVEHKVSSLESFNDTYDVDSPPSSTTLQFYVNQLVQVQASSDAAFVALSALMSKEEEGDELQRRNTKINDRLSMVISVLLDRLDKANAISNRNHSGGTTTSRIKIEPIKIPDFHGEWLSFRDKYRALIHDNKEFSKVIKFTYLQSYVKDKNAPASLKGSATEDGYDDAWKDVLNQYDNDRKLVRSLFDTLMKIKHMSDETESEMTRVKNEAQTCVDSIKRIEACEDPFSAIIAHTILFRMDNHSRDLFETRNENKIPTWESLSEFLTERSKTLGNCVTSKTTIKHSTGVLQKQNVKAHSAQMNKRSAITCFV